MRIDNLGAYVAGQESSQKKRPEMPQVKQPELAANSQRSLRFHKHQGAERWQVQVVDIYSNEIIREIPNRKALDIVGEMKNLIGRMQDVKC